MRDELFINGSPVDLDGKGITLDYKSNFLGDISKIQLSKSYSINLPKTVHNSLVFDNPDIPAYSSEFPYKFYKARYIRNGIEIISNGKALLMSSGDSYEVNLIFGLSSEFQEWTKNSTSLREIEDKGEYVIWGTSQIYARPGEGDVLFSIYDTGSDAMPPHPSVRASWLLDQVKPKGVTFQFPPDRQEFINKLLIPLTTREDSEKYSKSQSVILGADLARVDQSKGMRLFFTNTSFRDSYYIDKIFGKTEGLKIEGIKIKVENLNLSLIMDLSLHFRTANNVSVDQTDIKLILFNNEGEEIVSIQSDSATYLFPDPEYPNYNIHNITFNRDMSLNNIGNKGKVIYFKVLSGHGAILENPGSGNIRITPSVSEIAPRRDGATDGRFPIMPNLPDIKAVDFVKALCSMAGVFPVYNHTNTNIVRFTSIDELIGNKTKALDWSNRLIEVRRGEPKSISFRLSDFSQVNKLNYKEDEAVSDKNGTLFVDNETIEYKKDIFNLPFAASEGTQIVQYRRNADDPTKIESVKVQPRIMLEMNRGGRSGLTFAGLEFRTLIERHYSTYQKLIRKPVVIKDQFNLNEVDLKTLDFTIPVYIRQYGRYYAIVSIQANPSGVCECELLQLPTIK